MTSPAPAAGAAFIVKRCNPYGHETGGPKRLVGGLYGPEYEGRMKWTCPNPATIRARMICQGPAGHRGQVMDLCLPHMGEIQRRQAGLCPACAWPPEARMWQEVIERQQAELGILHATGQWDTPRRVAVQQGIDDAAKRMTELYQTGVIRKTGLILREIA